MSGRLTARVVARLSRQDSERKRKQKRKQPKSVPAALFDEFDVKRTGILGRTELRALIARFASPPEPSTLSSRDSRGP